MVPAPRKNGASSCERGRRALPPRNFAAGVMALGTAAPLAPPTHRRARSLPVGGGNQINLPVSPDNRPERGNAVEVAGGSTATSKGGASVDNSDTAGKGIQGSTSGKEQRPGRQPGERAGQRADQRLWQRDLAVRQLRRRGARAARRSRRPVRAAPAKNTTSGDNSLLGRQPGHGATAPPSTPRGNAVAIFGDAVAGCKGGAAVKNTGTGPGGNSTSWRSAAPRRQPGHRAGQRAMRINVCGVTVAVFGDAFSGCKGGSTSTNGNPGPKYHHGPGKPGSTGNDTDGRFGAGSGNQVIAPVNLPVNVCGNAIGGALAGCKGGTESVNTTPGTAAGGNSTSTAVRGSSRATRSWRRSPRRSTSAATRSPCSARRSPGARAVRLGQERRQGRGRATPPPAGPGSSRATRSSRRSLALINAWRQRRRRRRAGPRPTAPVRSPPTAGPVGGGNRTDGKSGVLAGKPGRSRRSRRRSTPAATRSPGWATPRPDASGAAGWAVRSDHTTGDGYDNLTKSWGKVDAAEASGPLPALPAMSSARQLTKMSAAGLPLVGDLPGMLGLPALPGLPGAPAVPAATGGKKALR